MKAVPEEEKKTNQQHPVFQQSFLNVISTYHWSIQQIKGMLAPYHLTHHQFTVLNILQDQYPSNSTLNLIRSKIVDQSSDISRTIDRLVFKGYVEKRVNVHDRRAVAVVITEKGLRLLRKVIREVDLSAPISNRLTVDEAAQLNNLLSKARACSFIEDLA